MCIRDSSNPNSRGTSAAAPHAAGVVALMLQSNRDLKPRDIKTILQLTAVDVTHRNDADRTFTGEEYDFDSGYGLVDAHRAVSLATTYNASTESAVDNLVPENITVHDRHRVVAAPSTGLRYYCSPCSTRSHAESNCSRIAVMNERLHNRRIMCI